MKKLVCIILTLVLVASVLVSCAPDKKSAETTSSKTAKYENYLTDRGIDISNFTITLEGDKYCGVDMSSFRDDGYVIRADRGDVVIAGKTADGLDRAVRCYAKYGNPDSYSVTYGEGYRVKELLIAGNDISDYAIVYEEYEYPYSVFTTDAANELASYIAKTCGVTVPVYGRSNKAYENYGHTITLKIDYDKYGDEAFGIDIGEDGNIVLSGGRYRGCLFAVYDLLRDMGWRFIADALGTDEGNKNANIEYLYEAECVNLTSELNRSEFPAIGYRTYWDGDTYSSNYKRIGEKNFINSGAMCQYGLTNVACHGLQNYRWLENEGLYGGIEATGVQPCFTNEDNIECVINGVLNEIEARLNAGQQIGREIVTIDVSQYDCGSFCQCKECLAAIKYDGSQSGPVLAYTNRVAEAVAEKYPGVSVSMLAYTGTDAPPKKTVPLDNVRISYCIYVGVDIACSHHCISGADCDPAAGYTNVNFAKQLDGWIAICKNRNLDVWYYPFNCYGWAFQSPYFTTLYDDMKYLVEYAKVNGIMFHANSATGGTLHSLTVYLGTILAWDSSVTREEYWKYIEEWFNIVYGDAGPDMYEYFCMNEKAAETTGCWCAFHSPNTDKVDNGYYAAHFDYWYNLFENAKDKADTSHQALLVELYESGMLYMELGITYDARYTNGTPEEREEFARRYEEAYRIFKDNHLMVFNDFVTREYVPDTLDLSQSPFDSWCTSWSN